MTELYEAVRNGIDKMSTSVNRLAENHNEFAQRLVALEQSKGISGALFASGAGGFGRKSLADQVFAALDKDGELLRKTGRLSFTLETKAAGDPVLGTTAGSVSTIDGVPFPGLIGYGLQSVLPPQPFASTTQAVYTRYTGIEGAAGVQAGEGTAKAAITPTFSKITQDAITVAGYCKVSEQVLNDRNEMRAAIDGVLLRQLNIALDTVLVDGAADPAFGGFEALATAYTSLVYTPMPDAVSEGVSTMQEAGFVPSIVAMSPADWLAIVTAKAAGSGEYLSGSYLGALPENMRGLRVAITSKVAAGKSLLIDPAFCQWFITQAMNFQVDRINDDFVKNLVVIRGEMRVIPVFRATGSARLITPKA